MNVLTICKFPKQSNIYTYFINTDNLQNKQLVNLLEKSTKRLTLSSKNYFSRLTEKDNLFKRPIRRNMTWLEECMFDSMAHLSLPAVVEKILYITIEDGTTNLGV